MNGGFWLPTVFYKFELQEENTQILSMQILPWIQFCQVHPKIEGIYNFSKKNSVKSLPKKRDPVLLSPFLSKVQQSVFSKNNPAIRPTFSSLTEIKSSSHISLTVAKS